MEEMIALVATGDESVRNTITQELESLMYPPLFVRHTSRAAPTLQLLSHFGPDIAFIDDELDVPAAELIATARLESPLTITVLVTALPEELAAVTADAMGAMHYLCKRAISRRPVERAVSSVFVRHLPLRAPSHTGVRLSW